MNDTFKKFYNLRIDNDFSQDDMAKILNINRRAYSHYKSGRNLFSLKLIVKFANYFKINIDYLFNLANKQTIKSTYEYDNSITAINILNIRKKLTLSQEQFGKLLNLSQRTYASYENNERTINIIILLNIAKTFNYSLNYLIGRSTDKKKEIKCFFITLILFFLKQPFVLDMYFFLLPPSMETTFHL